MPEEVFMKVIYKEAHETKGFFLYTYERAGRVSDGDEWNILYELKGPNGAVTMPRKVSFPAGTPDVERGRWIIGAKEAMEGSYDFRYGRLIKEVRSSYPTISTIRPTISLYRSLVRPGQYFALYVIRGARLEKMLWEYVPCQDFKENTEIWSNLLEEDEKAGEPPEPELTPVEVATAHGVTPQAIIAAIRSNRIPARREGGRWKIKKSDSEAYSPTRARRN